MTSTRVPVDRFERGTLPMVDVLTGEPADGRVELRAAPRSGFGPLLLLVGVLPFLVWIAMRTRPVAGSLPMTQASLDSIRRFDATTTKFSRVGFGLFLLGVVTVVAGINTASELTVAGGVLIVVAVMIWIVAHAWPSPVRLHLESNGRVVDIDAHPEFARQFESSLATQSH